MSRLTVGSLFAGIGGFDLAAERAGMTVAWQSEIDKHASNVLAHHWPDVPNLGDVHGVESPPAVDVLTGGFPCQDYSVAGNRGGLAGDRGALWWEYHRLIAGLRPTWVVGENVPGLLSSRDGADFETIVGSLTELGYGVAWAVLDAQYFGVAQRRRRVFIVGHSGGEPRPEVLALGEGLYGHSEPRRETGERTAPTLAARTRGGGWPGTDEALDGALAVTVTTGTGLRYDAETETLIPTVAFAQNQRDEVRELDQASSLNAERWGTAKNETLIAEVAQPLRTNHRNNSNPTTEASMHVVMSSSVRRLTPLECERIQGFPDGWTDIPGNSDTQRYRQLGNAVAVPVAEWLLGNVRGGKGTMSRESSRKRGNVMSEHKLSLVQDFEETDGSWFAECTCDWVGPERVTQYEAVKDHEAWHATLEDGK